MNQAKTISQYIVTFPKDIRDILEKLRSTIQRAAPGATETIKYGIPTFQLNGNLVHFAAFKKHIGFFPTSSPIRVFKKELAKYHTSKGTVQFPLDKAIPFGLVGRIVRYRVRQSSTTPHS